jgi:pyruvate,water dikinase
MVEHWIADSGLSSRFPIYTRANVGEVFPDPVTPLTADVGIPRAEWGWRDAWVRMGAFDYDEFDPNELGQLGITGGYCYLNASMTRVFAERAPGLSWQIMDEQLFGALPGIPPYQEEPGDIRPDLSEKLGATFGWVLTAPEMPELLESQAATKALRADRPDLGELSDEALVKRHDGLWDSHFRLLFAQHIYATFLATLPAGMLAAICAAVGKPEVTLDLLGGLGDVDSAAPSFALWELGRLVARDDGLTAAFDGGAAGLADRLAALDGPAASAFERGFADFVRDYGSRGPNEWEMRSPSWETRPELALAAIDRMRLSPDSAAPARQNAARADVREAAAAAIADALEADPAVQGQFLAAVRAAQTWLPARERTKTNAIRMVHEARMTMRELGRRMVERGAFDHVEDFGFLRRDELDAFVADPGSLTAAIRQRRVDYEELGGLEPPFLFVGEPPPLATWPARSTDGQALAVGDTLAGLPGCPGTVEGVACVLLDPSDPSALEPGDVLVAPITDPSWTPLFVPAAAVVVDVGALQSHAVIVSRELGIPCVVSATGATKVIPNGARVRVDGAAGTVTVLEA